VKTRAFVFRSKQGDPVELEVDLGPIVGDDDAAEGRANVVRTLRRHVDGLERSRQPIAREST